MKKIILILFTLLQFPANAKDLPHSSYWHGEERTLRYKPEGGKIDVDSQIITHLVSF